MSKKYNGYTNYATWRVNMEILGDVIFEEEVSVDGLKQIVEDSVFRNPGWSRFVEDYARAFISQVDFHEIANLINEEIIFTDNTLANFKFFTPSFINSIDLVDISNNSIQINNYLRQSLLEISNLFKVSQIEYVDGRRYNLYLVNGQIIMLPKKITKDLLVFIKQNYEILKNNTNFQEYLDLRNFHEKTIRAK